MKKILFTTDFSKYAPNTWKYALKLAQHFDAEITLLHVVQTVQASFSGDGVMEEMYEDQTLLFQEQEYKKALLKLEDFSIKNTPKQFHSIPLAYKAAFGFISSAIIEEERTGGYDLVVVGTSTTPVFPQRILGTVATKVMNQTTTPVFLVPPTARFYGIRKIIYATNFAAGDTDAIKLLMEWAYVFKSKLHLLHVKQASVEAQQAADKMKQLIARFETDNETDIIVQQILEGNIVKGIAAYIEFTGSDMVALTRHKRGLFERLFKSSVTNTMSMETMIPVLVFKEKKV